MEDPRTGRFWSGGHSELNRTSVGRAFWRRMRSKRRAAEVSEPRPLDTQTGPYETAYDVAHGYATERRIVLP